MCDVVTGVGEVAGLIVEKDVDAIPIEKDQIEVAIPIHIAGDDFDGVIIVIEVRGEVDVGDFPGSALNADAGGAIAVACQKRGGIGDSIVVEVPRDQ